MRQYIGFLYIVFAALGWSLIGPVSRFSLENGLLPIELAFWRCFLGGLFFSLGTVSSGFSKIQSYKDVFVFFIFGAFGVGALFAAGIYVVENAGAAFAAVLLYTAPVWVAIFSRIIFKEKLTAIKLLAIGLSIMGVGCISLSGNPTGGNLSPFIILCGLGTGLFFSSHFIFTKSFGKRYNVVSMYALSMGFAAISLFPFVTFSSKGIIDWGVILCLGLVSSFLSYKLYGEGMKYMEPTKASIIATLEPCFATLFAWWWWHESFALVGWFGAILIILSVVVLICAKEKVVLLAK